jgi:hypothetical protein
MAHPKWKVRGWKVALSVFAPFDVPAQMRIKIEEGLKVCL